MSGGKPGAKAKGNAAGNRPAAKELVGLFIAWELVGCEATVWWDLGRFRLEPANMGSLPRPVDNTGDRSAPRGTVI